MILGFGGCADSSTEDAVAKLGEPVRSLSPNAGSSAPDATIVPVDNIERGDETSDLALMENSALAKANVVFRFVKMVAGQRCVRR